jgi:hypothetical protein
MCASVFRLDDWPECMEHKAAKAYSLPQVWHGRREHCFDCRLEAELEIKTHRWRQRAFRFVISGADEGCSGSAVDP